MPRKWIGAAAWSAKEAKVGDRLPYARLIDENTVLLRDGSLMLSLLADWYVCRMICFSVDIASLICVTSLAK